MNKLDALRRVTKPMTEAKVTEIVRVRYGNVRQNASSDDVGAVQRAAGLPRRKAERKATTTPQRPGRAFSF